MASVFAPGRSKALRHAISSSQTTSASLPSFLLPAFQSRPFSATSPCASKLGRTPLSIPPGVEISLSNVQAVKGSRDWKPHAYRTITVKGPLGELSYDAPSYVRLEQDLEENRVLLSVENSDDKGQAAMWGEFRLSTSPLMSGKSGCWMRLLTKQRHFMVLPKQPHHGCIRRSLRHPAAGGCRLPCDSRAAKRQGAVPGPAVPVSEAGLHAPGRGANSQGPKGHDAATDENSHRGNREGDDHELCWEGEAVEEARALQGQGCVYQR